jgi:hypothetical protein
VWRSAAPTNTARALNEATKREAIKRRIQPQCLPKA